VDVSEGSGTAESVAQRVPKTTSKALSYVSIFAEVRGQGKETKSVLYREKKDDDYPFLPRVTPMRRSLSGPFQDPRTRKPRVEKDTAALMSGSVMLGLPTKRLEHHARP